MKLTSPFATHGTATWELVETPTEEIFQIWLEVVSAGNTLLGELIITGVECEFEPAVDSFNAETLTPVVKLMRELDRHLQRGHIPIGNSRQDVLKGRRAEVIGIIKDSLAKESK